MSLRCESGREGEGSESVGYLYSLCTASHSPESAALAVLHKMLVGTNGSICKLTTLQKSKALEENER